MVKTIDPIGVRVPMSPPTEIQSPHPTPLLRIASAKASMVYVEHTKRSRVVMISASSPSGAATTLSTTDR